MRKSNLLDDEYKKDEKVKELLQMDAKELPEELYTLIATAKIRRAEDDENLQQAIRGGDKKRFEEFIADLLTNQKTWGDHLKRYILDTTSGQNISITQMSDEKLMSKIYNAFAWNGMADRGSIHPDTDTSLQTQLEGWLKMPSNRLDRDTCFLFAFGLNMNEEWTSYLLMDVLRKADFNPRKPEEAIYYYCLYNNLKYGGVEKWLKKYKDLTPKERTQDLHTRALSYELQDVTYSGNDEAFLDYLGELKYLEQNRTTKKNKFSTTRAEVLNQILVELYSHLSRGKRQSRIKDLGRYATAKYEMEHSTQLPKYKREEVRRAEGSVKKKLNAAGREELEAILLGIPQQEIGISKEMEKLFAQKMLWMPTFSAGSIRKQIEDKTTEVKREDILLAAFILCAYDKGKYMANKNYSERTAYFTYIADYWLEKAGLGEFYFLSPFELFLTICLLQEKPLEYVLGIWKKYRITKEKKNEAKDSGRPS